MATHVFVKYVLHTVDIENEQPFENKAVFLLHVELILGEFLSFQLQTMLTNSLFIIAVVVNF